MCADSALMKFQPISFLLFFARVNAKLIFEAPACAMPCIEDYLASTPCRSSGYDLDCVCNDASQAGNELAHCLFDLNRCSAYDLAAFSEAFYQICPGSFISAAVPRLAPPSDYESLRKAVAKGCSVKFTTTKALRPTDVASDDGSMTTARFDRETATTTLIAPSSTEKSEALRHLPNALCHTMAALSCLGVFWLLN